MRQPLSCMAIRSMLVAVERGAGVEHPQGRSFYGLRGQAADLAPELAQDARDLNRLTGHADSTTRERVLPGPAHERVRAQVEARRSMRSFLREPERPDAAAPATA